jgi:hypothetical protein
MVTFSITVNSAYMLSSYQSITFFDINIISPAELGNLKSLLLDYKIFPTNDSIAVIPLVPVDLKIPVLGQ